MATRSLPKLTVRFYREASGSEPVRDWLKSLPADERREVGIDIKTVQFGWPLGMPVVDHVDRDIWEVRTRLANRLARVLFVLGRHGPVARIHQEGADDAHPSPIWICPAND